MTAWARRTGRLARGWLDRPAVRLATAMVPLGSGLGLLAASTSRPLGYDAGQEALTAVGVDLEKLNQGLGERIRSVPPG